MKFLSSKEMNKMAKSTLALVIAGTFTFSAATAFASENKEDEEFETVEIKMILQLKQLLNQKKMQQNPLKMIKKSLMKKPHLYCLEASSTLQRLHWKK